MHVCKLNVKYTEVTAQQEMFQELSASFQNFLIRKKLRNQLIYCLATPFNGQLTAI